MAISSAIVAELVAAGLSGDALVAACARIEAAAPARSLLDEAANRRRSVDRERKRCDWPALRAAVFARDGYACVYCGLDVSDDPQCDHVMPISRGGPNEIWNLNTACRPCNSSKGDKTPEEWVR